MVLVAENLTAVNPVVARALRELDPAPLRAVAADAARAGAGYLDLNLGPGRWVRGDALEFVLETLGQCWRGGLLVDTVDPEVMAQVAVRWHGEVVLNGYSGDAGRAAVLDVAADHGLQVVVLLMAGGVPRSLEDRLALAAQLAGECWTRGIDLSRLWFDPMVVPLGWVDGQRYNRDALEILRSLPALFNEQVRTLLGLSNLTTGAVGARRTPWLQQVFLAMAAGAGLTHAMVDIRDGGLLRTCRALRVIENENLYAPEEFRDVEGA